MPKPIPHDIRLKIIRDRQAGQSFATIAHSTNYSISGVKKIWYQFKGKGLEGLQLGYHRCGRSSPFSDDMHQLISSVKDGDQGAPFIRSILEHNHPSLRIPHERTIQRWWKAKGENREKIVRRHNNRDWTKEVHHTWQIDGKELVQLANKERVSWMNVADEASSSVLSTTVFPPGDNDQGGA